MSKSRADLERRLHRLRVKAARLAALITRAERALAACRRDRPEGSGPNGWPAAYWRRKRR